MTFSLVNSPAAKSIVGLVVAAMSLPGLSAVACECQDSSAARRCCRASLGDGCRGDAACPREGVCRCSQSAKPAQRATRIVSDVRPLVSLTSSSALAVDASFYCVPSGGAIHGRAHGEPTAASSLDRCVWLCRLTL